MKKKHLPRTKWLELIAQSREQLAPDTLKLLESGHATFTQDGVEYSTDPTPVAAKATHER